MTAPTSSPSPWMTEMLRTWALAAGSTVAVETFLHLALAAAAILSAFVGWDRWRWERSDRLERQEERHRTRLNVASDREDVQADRARDLTEHAADRAERGRLAMIRRPDDNPGPSSP
jgi:hypothetical protein